MFFARDMSHVGVKGEGVGYLAYHPTLLLYRLHDELLNPTAPPNTVNAAVRSEPMTLVCHEAGP